MPSRSPSVSAAAVVGMDSGRLMAMSSERQNPADEAALAAATQLDGKTDSITRAQTAVTNYFANAAAVGASGQLIVNQTLLAQRTAQGGPALTSVSFTFYTSYDSATDTFGTTTTNGALAKVVLLKINARRVYYALTPVVGAINSG